MANRVPEPSLGLLVIAARHAQRQAIAVHARRHRLTASQFWALYALHERPGITPGELGSWMQLDPPAASRLVADLSQKKLIEVAPDREDRRRTHLTLAEKGAALADKVVAVAASYQAAFVEGLTPEELEVFRRCLGRVTQNLGRFAGTEPQARGAAARGTRAG